MHKPGRQIKNHITKNFLPRPVQVQPVYVRLVKPIEKKVLISKPAPKPSCSHQEHQQPLPETPCAYASAPTPAPPMPPAPAPAPCGHHQELDPTSELELPAESVFAEQAYCSK